MQILIILLLSILNQPTLPHFCRNELHICRKIQRSIFIDKMATLIMAELLFYPNTMSFAGNHAHHHRQVFTSFEPGKSVVLQQIIKRLIYFKIHIHIQTSFLFQSPQPHIIAYERVFANLISFFGICNAIDVKVVLVPKTILPIGHKLMPTGNTILGQLRHFSTAKPTIMNCSRYHFTTPKSLKEATGDPYCFQYVLAPSSNLFL